MGDSGGNGAGRKLVGGAKAATGGAVAACAGTKTGVAGGAGAVGAASGEGCGGTGTAAAGAAVLLCAQAGAVVRVVVDAVSAPADAGAQLFTFSSSTSKMRAESGPMSRPAPRLP